MRDATNPRSSSPVDWRDRWFPSSDAWPAPGGRWRRLWRFPWAGIVLVLLGLALLAREIAPQLSESGLILIALGLALLAAWLVGAVRIAIVPALILVALGATRVLQDLGVLPGEGWTALALAFALAVLWYASRSRRRRDWLLWLAGILALVGIVQLTAQLPGMPDLSGSWPLVLVLAGLVVILASSRRRQRPV